MRLPLLALSLIIFLTTAHAKIELAALFTDSMVLQQNSEATIWGTDEPGQIVHVTSSWGEASEASTGDDGKWRLKIATPPAGGAHSLKVQGSSEIGLSDVLMGEVWLCSGQSNMEMPIKGFLNQPINGSQEAILAANKDNIRVFKVERNKSESPLDSVEGQWTISNSSTAANFSATAYFFAKKLQAQLDVPIGLIVTSWGGSSAEAWTDPKTLDELGIPIDEISRYKMPHQHPSLLYNGMLRPLEGYTIQGAIWYQGEANRNRPQEYRDLLTAMVTSWREKWGQGDFPFYYVQIAPFTYWKGTNSAYIREAQLQVMDTLPNSGMAVTLDIGDSYFIHPAEKRLIGDRLAYWALAKTYGYEGLGTSGPIYDRHESVEGGKILVHFKGTLKGVNNFGKELTGFEVAGADKVFYPATVKIDRRIEGALTVWSDEVPEPVAVRYAFTNLAEATLFGTSGLPASSFRTDDWAE